MPALDRAIFKRHVPLLAILLLGAFLFFFRSNFQSLWGDEGYSWADAKNLGTANLKTRPLYYLLFHFWLMFSESVVWMRAFSALFAIGSVFLIFRLGDLLFNRSVGIVAALLLTTSPLFINRAQEVRMYAMGTFLVLLGCFNFSGYLMRNSRLCWVVWILARVSAVLTIPLSALILICDGVIAILEPSQKRTRTIFGGMLAAGLLSLPSLVALKFEAPRFLNGWVARVPKPNFLQIFELILSRFTSIGINTSGLIHFCTGFFALMGIFYILDRRSCRVRRGSPKIWVEIWGLLPFIIFCVYSLTQRNMLEYRFCLYFQPFFLLFFAQGFLYLRSKNAWFAAGAVCIYVVMTGLSLNSLYSLPLREDWRSSAEVIRSKARPNDTIMVLPGTPNRSNSICERGAEALKYYYRGGLPILCPKLSEANAYLTRASSDTWIVFRHVIPEFQTIGADFWMFKKKLFTDNLQVKSIDSFMQMDVVLVGHKENH